MRSVSKHSRPAGLHGATRGKARTSGALDALQQQFARHRHVLAPHIHTRAPAAVTYKHGAAATDAARSGASTWSGSGRVTASTRASADMVRRVASGAATARSV